MNNIPRHQPDHDAMIEIRSIGHPTDEDGVVVLALYSLDDWPIFVLDRQRDHDGGCRWAMVDGERVLIVNDGNPEINFSLDGLQQHRDDIDAILQAWHDHKGTLDALDWAVQ